MVKRIVRRVLIWVVFGFILTAVPLIIVAFMNAETISGFGDFINQATNEELLAIAFTLAAAAAADVWFSADSQKAVEWKIACGSVTFVLAIFTAMMYVVFKTHSYHIPRSEVVPGIQILYGVGMFCALVCEGLSEVK